MPSLSMNRRRVLTMLGGLGVLAACGTDDSGSSTTPPSTSAASTSPSTSPSTSTSGAAATTKPSDAPPADLTSTPAETGGPFPADGSNDNGSGSVANVLADPRSVRSDIRSDLDGSNTQ